jgi:DNA-binding NarL/FixJ family response regulator
VRVALAEDSVLLRDGLGRLLNDEGFEVVAQCEDAAELMRKLSAHAVDVAILDIRLPPTHTDEGLRAALEIRERYPGTAILVLSQYVELGLAMKLLSDSAEGTGYLLKDRISEVAEFVDAVRRVADGGSAIDPQIVSTLLSRLAHRRSARRAHPARARGARTDGQRHVQQWHRREPGDQPRRGREVRLEHLRQARASLDGYRIPARTRGAAVPQRLKTGAPRHQETPPRIARSAGFRRKGLAAILTPSLQPVQEGS